MYAKRHDSYGLATIRKEHATVRRDGSAHLRYPAKSGQLRDVLVEDPVVAGLVTTLKRRRGGVDLLAWRETGEDGRLAWHATVLSARAPAAAGPGQPRRRKATGSSRNVSHTARSSWPMRRGAPVAASTRTIVVTALTYALPPVAGPVRAKPPGTPSCTS